MANDIYETEEERRQRLLAEQMKREEAALTSQLTAQQPPLELPVSQGRMYMGPELPQGAEEAFLQMPSGTSLNLVAPPSGPRIPPPTRLEELRATDIPPEGDYMGSRTLSVREGVPIPVPEGASAQFAALQEWNRLAALGIPPEERVKRAGLDYFLPRGRTGLMNEYQRESTRMRGEEIAQSGKALEARLAREEAKSKSAVSPGVSIRYRALIDSENKARAGFDDDEIQNAKSAREQFEREHPELGIVIQSATGPVTISPPSGVTRTGTPQTITSKAQFDALPKGAVYIGKDGKHYRKP